MNRPRSLAITLCTPTTAWVYLTGMTFPLPGGHLGAEWTDTPVRTRLQVLWQRVQGSGTRSERHPNRERICNGLRPNHYNGDASATTAARGAASIKYTASQFAEALRATKTDVIAQ
jgi:hypothetical protein